MPDDFTFNDNLAALTPEQATQRYRALVTLASIFPTMTLNEGTEAAMRMAHIFNPGSFSSQADRFFTSERLQLLIADSSSIQTAIRSLCKIEAIKILRNYTGISLARSKREIEIAMEQQQPF